MAILLVLVEKTIKASDTLEHQPTAWPVPYACTQPYHPGSARGSHGQHSRPPRPRSFWSAPRIATSGLVQRYVSLCSFKTFDHGLNPSKMHTVSQFCDFRCLLLLFRQSSMVKPV